jgi:DNA-binding response OmpR family regulator
VFKDKSTAARLMKRNTTMPMLHTRPVAPSRSLTALVADPDATQRQHVSACLGAGYRVLMAGHLAEATQMIARDQPQVLMLELNQPDGDGIQLIRRLRANPSTSRMVIVCVTTRRGIRDKVASFQAGADDYVVKPVDAQSFPLRVAMLTRLHRLSS